MKNILFFTAALFIFTACKKGNCGDGKKNQDETYTDCGGSCNACPTCSDGILNQNEVSIDCGGSCNACASCSDGILNQNETGIDCGGVCAACPIPLVTYPTTCVDHSVENVLDLDSTDYTSVTAAIDMRADYANGATLAVNIHSFTSGDLLIGLSSGWNISGNSTNSIWAFSTDPVYSDAEFFIMSTGGTAVIDYFENGADTSGTPTFSKTISY